MAKIKGWTKVKNTANEFKYYSDKKTNTRHALPKGTIQAFGQGNVWNISIYKAVLAPNPEYAMNQRVFERSNLRNGQVTKEEAKRIAIKYMRSHPNG